MHHRLLALLHCTSVVNFAPYPTSQFPMVHTNMHVNLLHMMPRTPLKGSLDWSAECLLANWGTSEPHAEKPQKFCSLYTACEKLLCTLPMTYQASCLHNSKVLGRVKFARHPNQTQHYIPFMRTPALRFYKPVQTPHRVCTSSANMSITAHYYP
jgi:hypothetical protein